MCTGLLKQQGQPLPADDSHLTIVWGYSTLEPPGLCHPSVVPAADGDNHLTRGAERLGDLVNGQPEHVDDTIPKLVARLAQSDDPAVTRAVVDSLGHAWHPAAAEAVLDNVPLDHPDDGVRLAVAQALPNGRTDEPGDLFDRVVDALIGLTRDEHPRVRDWAAFGLGQMEARTPHALDALAALLDDEDDDTCCEALEALAEAGDGRALPVLRRRLEDGVSTFRLELLAAITFAAPELHAALHRKVETWGGDSDEDEMTDLANIAAARTAPGAARAAEQVEQHVLQQVRLLAPNAAQVVLTGAYPRTVLMITGQVKGQELPLWAERERPDRYPTEDLVKAVRYRLAHPAE